MVPGQGVVLSGAGGGHHRPGRLAGAAVERCPVPDRHRHERWEGARQPPGRRLPAGHAAEAVEPAPRRGPAGAGRLPDDISDRIAAQPGARVLHRRQDRRHRRCAEALAPAVPVQRCRAAPPRRAALQHPARGAGRPSFEHLLPAGGRAPAGRARRKPGAEEDIRHRVPGLPGLPLPLLPQARPRHGSAGRPEDRAGCHGLRLAGARHAARDGPE